MAFEGLICCGGIILGLLVLFVFYLFSVYNGLVSLRNNVDKAWANIDVLLKQRSDLIPNLVQTVKGYMKYEKQTLIDITALRASIMTAHGPQETAKHSEAITASLKTIFAVSEKYPDLKADDNFLDLQKQLTEMENGIADRREFYNDSVMLYNTRIKSLPDSIIAGMFHFTETEYFRAVEEEKAPVQVDIDK